MLNGTSFLSVEIEEPMIQFFGDFSLKPTIKFQLSTHAVNDHVYKEKSTEVLLILLYIMPIKHAISLVHLPKLLEKLRGQIVFTENLYKSIADVQEGVQKFLV